MALNAVDLLAVRGGDSCALALRRLLILLLLLFMEGQTAPVLVCLPLVLLGSHFGVLCGVPGDCCLVGVLGESHSKAPPQGIWLRVSTTCVRSLGQSCLGR